MKRKIIYGLGAILVATATLGAVANGPYYALPAWAQKLVCATTSNCPRFIVLADWNSEAVLDRETGLVWDRSPIQASVDWLNGSLQCLQQRTGNRAGWRLPTVNELASLFDPSVTSSPFLPAGHPFTNVPLTATRFWTLTPGIEPGRHHAIGSLQTSRGIELSLFGTASDEIGRLPIWCVRGGLATGAQ